MELTQEQAEGIIELREALLSYKAACDEAGVKYKEHIPKYIQDRMEEDVVLIRTHYKNAVAVVSGKTPAAPSVVAAPTTPPVEQEDIDITSFAIGVTQWRGTMEDIFHHKIRRHTPK